MAKPKTNNQSPKIRLFQFLHEHLAIHKPPGVRINNPLRHSVADILKMHLALLIPKELFPQGFPQEFVSIMIKTSTQCVFNILFHLRG